MPTPDGLAQADEALTRIMTHVAPIERAIIQQTAFTLSDHPSPEQLAEFPPDGYLLGEYTSPPPAVSIFEEQIKAAEAAGVVPTGSLPSVVLHEVGHVLGYSHGPPGSENNGVQGMRARCGVLPGSPLFVDGKPH